MGRPQKPIISKALATRAALDVIDAQGIDALSLDAVAKRLGVRAPSLYYHFRNKAELLGEVARHILMEASVPLPQGPANWRAATVDLSISVRRSILRHARAAPLILQFFPRHLLLAAYDHWLAHYDVPAELHMVIVEGVENLTFGSALFAAMSRANGVAPMPHFDPAKLPHLAAAVAANGRDEEGTFKAALEHFLNAF
jgi:TetR/AcrR family tetracycline transcriptional repressor